MTPKTGKCPVCGKPPDKKFGAFCSSRCSLIDLGKWLGEGYRIQTGENDTDEPAPLAPNGDEKEI